MTLTTTSTALHRAIWQWLQEGHHEMRAGRYLPAMDAYRRALRHDLRLVYHVGANRSGWHISPQPEPQALNWACIYLGEYFVKTRLWDAWNQLAHLVFSHPGFSALPADQKSRLIGLRGMSAYIYGRKQLTIAQVIHQQQRALRRLAPTGLNAAIHHLVLGLNYSRLRQFETALTWLNRMQGLITLDEEPYYFLLSREFTASTYYYMNKKHPRYFNTAIEVYTATEAQIRQRSAVDWSANAYNLGWVYAEMGRLDDAQTQFEAGCEEANQSLDRFEKGCYPYGLGYVALCQGNLDQAEAHLLEALRQFGGHFFGHAAAVLNLLASVYVKKGDDDRALNRLGDALDNLDRANNPLQRYHVVRQLVHLHRRQRRWHLMMWWLPTLLWLKRRLRMRLFPL
jgi:tetratricopeptide (TPR) repeat protein